MTEITGPTLHRALVDCRDQSMDVMCHCGIKLYRYQAWGDGETQFDAFEDLLLDYYHDKE